MDHRLSPAWTVTWVAVGTDVTVVAEEAVGAEPAERCATSSINVPILSTPTESTTMPRRVSRSVDRPAEAIGAANATDRPAAATKPG